MTVRGWKLIGAWTPAVLWMLAIFFVSALPKLPDLPSALASDKMLHAAAYFILGLLLYRAAVLTDKQPLLGPVIVGTAYGVFDEVHQYFVPGRDMSGLDLIADIAGLAASVLTVAVIRSMRAKRGKSHGR